MLKRELIENLCDQTIEREEREKLKALLLQIAEKVLLQIVTIKVDHESGLRRTNGERLNAAYDPQTKTITIYAMPFDPKYACYLYHEIGHCIFYEFQDVAHAAKIECQKGERNKLELYHFSSLKKVI
jgi:hypothetical protein